HRLPRSIHFSRVVLSVLAPLPHLHSLPTRRSSDLAQALEQAGFQVRRQANIGARDVYLTALEKGEIDVIAEYSGNAAQYYQAGKDRKSTRLNSSHVSISYAVFCLKKRKRKSPTNDR